MQIKILIATHNQAKFKRYKNILEGVLGLEILSLFDFGIVDKVDEIFDTNKENAMHKAKIYGDISGEITLAIDEAVVTNFLPENEQPGVYVRRFGGGKKELTDNEIIQTWKKIFRLYPQKNKKFIWNFALAWYNPKNNSIEAFQVEQISYLAGKFSSKESRGYPMSTILSPIEGGDSFLETDSLYLEKRDKDNFGDFIRRFEEWIRINN